MARLASIDLGTNTFRLLIAEMKTASSFEICHAENRMTRLGEGFAEEKRIRPAAMQRALLALGAFRQTMEAFRVEAVAVVGTSALREAENRDLFLEAVKNDCGFEVAVLSGEEEARCTLLGVSLLFKQPRKKLAETLLVCDIGGGSTEFIGTDGSDANFILSLPLGAVALFEKYLISDPPMPAEIAALKRAIVKHLKRIGPDRPRPRRFIGTGGTITTFAAIDQKMRRYNPDRINGREISWARVKQILEHLSGIPAKTRAKIPGLESGREDIILSGGLILMEVMNRFGYDSVSVCDYGLREGVLIDLFKNRGEGKTQIASTQ